MPEFKDFLSYAAALASVAGALSAIAFAFLQASEALRAGWVQRKRCCAPTLSRAT